MKTLWNLRSLFVSALLLGLFSLVLASCNKKEEAPAPTPIPAPAARAPKPTHSAPAPVEESTAAPAQVAKAPAPPPPPPAPQGDPLALVDQFLASMHSANVAFNSPQTLNLSETANIQLLLSLKKSIEELRREIASSGPTEGASVKVANRMEARLTGPNFQITAITTEEQAIGANDTVEWKWEIKPLATGTHNLHLTLTAIFNIDGATTRRSIRTFDKTIEVEVTPRQIVVGFVVKNWQWLWAAVLLPIGGWFWKRRTSKH